MIRDDRRAAWQALLGEPVTAAAEVRIVSSPGEGAVLPRRGTALLTDTRFLMVGSRFLSRITRNSEDLTDRIVAQCPRSDVTGVARSEDGSVDLRWLDGVEKRIVFRPRGRAEELYSLMESDLSGE